MKMDWRTARIYAAVMSWPVILVCVWIGMHFGGSVGATVGAFIGMAAYFLGIWRALPKDDDPPNVDKDDRSDDEGSGKK